MRCCEINLSQLVESDADVLQLNSRVAKHLESCVECQRALQSLGGNGTWWEDAHRHLGSRDESQDISSANDQALASSDAQAAIDLSFLEPAAQPELLGMIGRYDVEGILGRGGMGVVMRGFDRDLNRTVAIKVLSPQVAHCPGARERFAREAQAAASIAHDNVLPIYNVQATGENPFLVMPYIPGKTLQTLVKTYGPPDVETVLRIAMQLADGLVAAHAKGIIHRDIKPSNVLVGENVQRVWLTDFGLARTVDDASVTHTGIIAGTPHYMSPEQARGERLDWRTDLFSFGGLLFFLCTGKPPFHAESSLGVLHQVVSTPAPPLNELRSDLPPTLVYLVAGMLAKNPDDRPANAAVVRQQLDLALLEARRNLRMSAMRLTRPMQWFRHRSGTRRTPSQRRLTLLLGALLVLSASLLFWRREQDHEQRVPSSLPVIVTQQSPLPAETTVDTDDPIQDSRMMKLDQKLESAELTLREQRQPFNALTLPIVETGDDWDNRMSAVSQTLRELQRQLNVSDEAMSP